MDSFGIIYKATNKINGKVYIGQTTQGLDKRKYNHIWAAANDKYKNKCNDFFHNAIKKYGSDQFEWSMLYECSNKKELDNKEQYYVNKFRSFVGLKNCNGYNLTAGGGGNSGVVFSETHRRRLSESKKGKKLSEVVKQKIRDNAKINPNYGNKGRSMSDVTKEKLRQCNLGKKLLEETKRKIGLANVGNSYAKGYRHTDEVRKKISVRTKGENNPMYGVPSPMTGKFGKDNSNSKKYVVTTPTGDSFIVVGIYDFCNKYNYETLHHSALIRVARGKQKLHKGYNCKYFDEDINSNLSVWEAY